MLVKSRLKSTRKVLFEKRSKQLRTVEDIFKELTDGCKIMYDPGYKSRFFLVRNNKIILTVLTHGKNKAIVVELHFLRAIRARRFEIHISQVTRHIGARRSVLDFTKILRLFVERHGYKFYRGNDVQYYINHKALVYLNKNDNVTLKTGDLWFSV